MTTAIQSALARLIDGCDLDTGQMQEAVADIMDGDVGEAEIAALLTALRVNGETVDEIVGAVQAMDARAVHIDVHRQGLLDTCGTGGDGLHTFNISTATALVAAAAGVPVAKHGNRGVSSTSGSSDVLEALGVNVALAPDRVARCVEEIGIGFCFAPLFHGAMKYAAPVRKQLGFRTIFNLLGPLTNPASAAFQLVGANRIEIADKLARALLRLGRRRALVVCGNDELDEVSLWGETTVFVVAGGRVTEETWSPETLSLPACRVEDLQVRSPTESAAVIGRIFAGETGPARDMVLANTAAALIAAERAEDPQSAVKQAAAAIDSGNASRLCERLAEWTNT
jgi:anthranilate phosphoribosyltransferase